MGHDRVPCGNNPITFVQSDMEKVNDKNSQNNVIFMQKWHLVLFHIQWKKMVLHRHYGGITCCLLYKYITMILHESSTYFPSSSLSKALFLISSS